MKNLKLLRKINESGFKKIYVAAQANMHPSELSHILSGRMNASVDEKKGLAKTLKCKVSDIFDQNM